MIGLSLQLSHSNATLDLSVDLPTALTATLNVSDSAITQQLLFDAGSKVLQQAPAIVSSVVSDLSSTFGVGDQNTTGVPAVLLHAPEYTDETALRVSVLTLLGCASLLGNVATMWNIRNQEGYRFAGGSGAGAHGGGSVSGGGTFGGGNSGGGRCIGVSLFDAGARRWRNRRRRRRYARRLHSWSAVYFLIFHLAVADLLVTAFCIGGEAAWSYSVAWRFGVWACKGLKFAQMFSLYLSTFVMVLVGVDRWVAVKYPWKSLQMQRRCYRLVTMAYVVAAVLSVPQLFVFDVVRGPFVEEFHQCVTYGFYTARWQEQLYTSFTLMCMFVLPLVVLIGTYVATFRTIAASERMFQRTDTQKDCNNTPTTTSVTPSNTPTDVEPPSPAVCEFNGMDRSQSHKRQKLIHRAKIKSLRISVVIVSAFIVCWSPYYIMMLMFVFLDPDRRGSDSPGVGVNFQSAIFCFGMSNSVVNPIVYGMFHLWPMRRRRRRMTAGLGGTLVTTGTVMTGHGGSGHRSSLTKETNTQRSSVMVKSSGRSGHEDHSVQVQYNDGRHASMGSTSDAVEQGMLVMSHPV